MSLANEFIDIIKKREYSLGASREDVNSYTMGYLIGTIDTLVKKYPVVSEDIKGLIGLIKSDIREA
jgi:hypothetical protein